MTYTSWDSCCRTTKLIVTSVFVPISNEEKCIFFLDLQVECVKNLDETQDPKFDEPNGWTNQKCRSEIYPDFRADPCICPGDSGVNRGI